MFALLVSGIVGSATLTRTCPKAPAIRSDVGVAPGSVDPQRAARDGHVASARERLEAGDHAGAAMSLDRALEVAPMDAEALALQVRAFRALRRYAAARSAASRILEKFPESPLARILLGSISFQEGDALSARRDLERAAGLDTSSALALAQIASLDLMEGHAEQAATAARQALSIDPGNVTALRVLTKVTRSVPDLILLHERILRASGGDPDTLAWLTLLRSASTPEINYVAPAGPQVVIPCETGPDGRLYARASIGSQENLRFLIDTGASGMLVSETIARRLGLPLQEVALSVGVGGATRHAHPVIVDTFRLAGLRARAILGTASRLPPEMDGILNPCLLAPPGSGLEVLISPGRRQIIFRQSAKEADLGGEARHVSVPFLADGLHVIFPIMLAGRPARALLDTGAAKDMADAETISRLGGVTIHPPDQTDLGLSGFGGPVRIEGMAPDVVIRIAGIERTIGRLHLVDLNAEAFRLAVDLDAIIGIGTLAAFDLVISPGSGTVTFIAPLSD